MKSYMNVNMRSGMVFLIWVQSRHKEKKNLGKNIMKDVYIFLFAI